MRAPARNRPAGARSRVRERAPVDESPDGERRRAYACGLRALARRPRSVAEMRALLTQRGFSPSAVEATVAQLCEMGALDDAAAADAVVRDAERRSLGSRRVRLVLRRRGIEAAVADAAAGQSAASDAEGARRWLARRFPDGPPRDPRGRARVLRALVARGFSGDAARRALGIDLVRGEDVGDCDDLDPEEWLR